MQKWHLKSWLVIPVFLCLAIATASAQRKLNFRTVEMGIGPSMVSLHDNDPLTTRTPKPSFAASVGLTYALKRNLFITNHVVYELKGGKSTKAFAEDEQPAAQYNYTMSYLTVAPGVRKYLRSNSPMFFEGGPFLAFLLSSNRARTSNVNPFATFDAGFTFGVGYTPRRTQYRGLSIRLVNTAGLKDVGLDTGTKEWTNSLALIVGTRIRMR